MQQFLLFQHERDSSKPILDDDGRLIPRDGVLIDGINCDAPMSDSLASTNKIRNFLENIQKDDYEYFDSVFDKRD